MCREPERTFVTNQCFVAKKSIVSEHTRTQCSNDTSDLMCSHDQACKKKQQKMLLCMCCWCQVTFSLWQLNERLAGVFRQLVTKAES